MQVRVQIVCDGEVTSDETAEEKSRWRAIGDLLEFGGYAYKLRDFRTTDGWLSYTCNDGTVVRAIEVMP